MARPKSWFQTSEYNDAKRATKDRGHKLWKFTRKNRDGLKVQGYFVGTKLPVRLHTANVEAK